MRLLLDECIPARLSRALVGHEVLTVGKNLPHQQNSANLPVAVFVLDAHSNELHHLLLLVPRLEEALLSMRPRSYVLIKAAEA
jgi:hypothetical protein